MLLWASWTLARISSAVAVYRLNADFEDRAEHEYMFLVSENPEWEEIASQSGFAADCGAFDSVADRFR